MEKVTKVLMYIYRRNSGKIEFFVQDHHAGYFSVLSGHVGDNIPDETLADAARRETVEELGVEPISVKDLDFCETVELPKHNKISTENAFLIEIPNKDVHYLEGDEKHIWVSPDKLVETLTFQHQKKAAEKISDYLNR